MLRRIIICRSSDRQRGRTRAMKRVVTSPKLELSEGTKEKLPLSANPHRNHGSIQPSNPSERKLPNLANGTAKENKANTTKPEQNEEKQGSLTIKRKISFLLSLSVWVLYFAFFLYLIPCKRNSCRLLVKWTVTFGSSDLATNLEYVQNDGDRGKVVVLGYSSRRNNSLEDPWSVAAVNITSGRIAWNRTTPFQPRYLRCQFEDVSGTDNETAKCIAIGDSDILYFNLLNGNVLWHRSLFPDIFHDSVLPEFSTASNSSSLIYAADRKENGVFLNVLESESGFKLTSVAVPCEDSPLLIQRDDQDNFLLACRMNEVTDVWLVPESTMFNLEEKESEPKNMVHLYQLQDAEKLLKIITLDRDRILIVTDAAVALITTASSVGVQWRTEFSNATIIDAVVGHFSSKTDDEMVVLLETPSEHTEVGVLKLSSGAKASTASIRGKRPASLLLAPGKNSSDSILLRTEPRHNSPEWDHVTASRLLGNRTEIYRGLEERDISYYYLSFSTSISVTELLTTPAIRISAVVSGDETGNHMLVAKQETGGNLRLTSYLLQDPTAEGVCTS